MYADGPWESRIYYAIVTLRQWGADPALVERLRAWAQTMWPNFTW
jgi:hypothetical protein